MKIFTLSFLLFACVFTSNAQWQKVSIDGFPQGVGLINLYDDGQVLWAGGTGQIYKSNDRGSSWTVVSNGLQSAISGNSGLVKLGNRMYACFAGNGNYFTYYTTDEGANWVLDTAGWQGPAPIQLHTHGEYVLARLESNFILYKKNTDTAWKKLITPDAFRTPGHMYSIGDTLVLGAGYIAMTTDMGQNWTTRQTTYPFPFGFISKMIQDRDNPRTFYANYIVLATNQSKLMVSRNGQSTWDSLTIPQDFPASLAGGWVKGNDVILAFTGSFTAADTVTKVFRSLNGGSTFNNITGDLYSLVTFRFHSINSMVVADGTLFGAGLTIPGAAMVKLSLPVGLNEQSVEAASLFYPNPASDFIQLTNEVEQASVFNMQGQQVLQYNRNQQNKLAVTELPTGMYWLQLQLPNQTVTVKLMKQ